MNEHNEILPKHYMEGTIFAVQSFLRGALNRPVNEDQYLRTGLKLSQTSDY